MPYVTELADLLTKNLERFVTLNDYQLAGHLANLEFWIGQVEHCLQVIDGYKTRFETMAVAQADFAKKHHSVDWQTISPFHDSAQTPKRPKKVPDHERKTAKIALMEACYRFLVRLFNVGLIDRNILERLFDRLDLSLNESDLKR